MSTRVQIEDIEATKSEKLLSLVLAVFLLIGGVWAYVKIDDYVREAVDTPALTSAQRAAIDRLDAAREARARADGDVRAARDELELRREAYRTALDANRPAAGLARRYERAQRVFEGARRTQASAERNLRAAEPAARKAQDARGERFEREYRRESLLSFLFRLVLTLAWIGGALLVLTRLRRRNSRWLALGFAAVGSAAVLSLLLAADYVTDYVDPLGLGPLVLSLFGIGATVVAFWALQRYLARRLPARRARKGECPFCGYPVRDHGPHCEGCGREVVAPCTTCGGGRRVGVPHCAACGAS